MKRSSKPRRRRSHKPHVEEQLPKTETSARVAKPAGDRLSSFYAAGPALNIAAPAREASHSGKEQEQQLPALGPVHTRGQTHQVTALGGARTLRLEGRTTGTFDHGNSRFTNVRARRASGCAGCPDAQCVRVTGKMVIRYHVTTQVTLPSVNDYPDLTACQRQRVQDAIDNILAPHEQQHVRAFETYNGTTEHRFDLKVCQGSGPLEDQVSAQLQPIHDSENAAREQAAQAQSDALDPFHFDVDLDCEDEP